MIETDKLGPGTIPTVGRIITPNSKSAQEEALERASGWPTTPAR